MEIRTSVTNWTCARVSYERHKLHTPELKNEIRTNVTNWTCAGVSYERHKLHTSELKNGDPYERHELKLTLVTSNLSLGI